MWPGAVTTPAYIALWLGIVACFACVANLALRVPRLRAQTERVEASRLPALDGLRGVLALSVFVHHAYLTRVAAIGGLWGVPGNAFVQVLGLGAVAIFFMITAFLFWSRALAARGRLAPLPLYRARLRRIYPAFAGSIALLLLVAGCETHFRLREAPLVVLAEIAREFSLGIATGSTVNGRTSADLINANVTWSLGFEFGFYAALPFLALSQRNGRGWLAFAAVALVAVLFERHCWIVACFVPGMLAAECAARPRSAAWFIRNGNALALAGCVVLVSAVVVGPSTFLTLERGPRLDVAPQLAALVAIFAGVALGPGPKFLARIELHFLGAISYSVYLLHAIVLYVASRLLWGVVPVRTLGPEWYWLFVVACVPAVVALATCSYWWLEAPFTRSRRHARAAQLSISRVPR